MEKVTKKILPGFTEWDGIPADYWKGFGWFGDLHVMLDREFYIMSAGGTASGGHGDMTFKIFEDITQEQADRIRVIAYRTDNPA